MEELERITRGEISGEILERLAGASSHVLEDEADDNLNNVTPRFTATKMTQKSFAELSAIVSRRRGVYLSQDFRSDAVIRRHHREYSHRITASGLRGDKGPIRLKTNQKERPVSEFMVPNDWKQKHWDVSPIVKHVLENVEHEKRPVPPNTPKPKKRTREAFIDYGPIQEDDLPKVRRGTVKILDKDKESKESESGIGTSISNALQQDPPSLNSTLTKSDILPPIISSSRETYATTESASRDPDDQGKRKSRRRKREKKLEQQRSTTNSRSPEKLQPPPTGENLSWTKGISAAAELAEPGWGSRTLDIRVLERMAREALGLDDVVSNRSPSIICHI